MENESRRVQVSTPQETQARFIGASSATHSLLHPVSAAIFNRNIYIITDIISCCILVFSLTVMSASTLIKTASFTFLSTGRLYYDTKFLTCKLNFLL